MASQNRDLFSFWIAALDTWSVVHKYPIVHWDQVIYQMPDGSSTQGHQVGSYWAHLDAQQLTLQTTMKVPYSQPYLILDIDGETLVRINQEPIFGLNAFHRTFHVPKPAGETLTLTLEIGRFGLMGQHFDNPQIRELAWYEIDEDIYHTYLDLKILTEYLYDSSTPNAIQSWLNRELEAAILPIYSLPPDRAAWQHWLSLHPHSADEEGLRRYLSEHDVNGLRDVSRDVLKDRIKNTQKRLQDLWTRLNQDFSHVGGKITAVGHAHIDLAWLWPMRETQKKVVRTLATQTHLLDQYPEFTFDMSSPSMWKMIEDKEPGLFARMRRYTLAQRIQPLGAFWVESDGQLPDASSMIRHMVYTLRYFMEHVGVRPQTAFLPDTFGFSEGLPTLLARAGIRLFCTTKLNWNDTTAFPYKDFWWVGPDGSRIQAHIFGGPERGYNGSASVQDVVGAWQAHQPFSPLSDVLYTYGHGDGGGGPDQVMLERFRRYDKLPGVPHISHGHVADLIVADETPLPMYRGELYLEYHRGTFTSQTPIKYRMRQAQEQLRTAELLSVWTGRQHDFHVAWERLLNNQFHDILPGSGIRQVYADCERDWALVQREIDAAVDASIPQLLKTPTNDHNALVIINRSDLPAPPRLIEFQAPYHPEIFSGQRWQSAQKTAENHYVIPVPPMDSASILTFPIRARSEALEAAEGIGVATDQSEWSIDTGSLHLVLRPDGIHQLSFDGYELLQGPAGIRAYWHHPDRFDAWELMPNYHRSPCNIQHDRGLEVESGTFCHIIRLHHRIEHSEVREVYRVDTVHHTVQVTISAHIRNRHLLVRYELPTTLQTKSATAETMWGTTEHATLPGSVTQAAQFEWVAHRFVDLSEGNIGLTIMNNGRYGHSVQNARIGVTLSTAPLYPDPTADIEPTTVTLGLVPHKGPWQEARIMQTAHAFSAGVWTRVLPVAGNTYRSWARGLPENIRILGVKASEDGLGDVVLYLGEALGHRGRATWYLESPFSQILRIDLVTETAPAQQQGRLDYDAATKEVRMTYKPYELMALRITTP